MGGDHFVSYPILRAIAAKHGPVCRIFLSEKKYNQVVGRLDHPILILFFRSVIAFALFELVKESVITEFWLFSFGTTQVEQDFSSIFGHF